ncbi:MAG: phosphopantetheine-binding protein [Desulfobacteraceae bacterium]|jgi:acyl carrier protein|nr:phosphopantetheine-binding protein [Desulfobacteraceae bacterium]
MNIDEIKPVIFGILRGIAPESDPSTLDPDENIRQALDIDSFDALNFFVRINDTFGISVPESDYGRLNTMSEILGYLSNRME